MYSNDEKTDMILIYGECNKRCLCRCVYANNISGDQEGLFKLAVQLRKKFNWVIYNTATGYVLLIYLTNI
jgi:hypothetical protein